MEGKKIKVIEQNNSNNNNHLLSFGQYQALGQMQCMC